MGVGVKMSDVGGTAGAVTVGTKVAVAVKVADGVGGTVGGTTVGGRSIGVAVTTIGCEGAGVLSATGARNAGTFAPLPIHMPPIKTSNNAAAMPAIQLTREVARFLCFCGYMASSPLVNVMGFSGI